MAGKSETIQEEASKRAKLGSGRIVGNLGVAREILTKFEVSRQPQFDAMSIQVDELTPDQEQYLASWSEGT
jgi:hypothetical protein